MTDTPSTATPPVHYSSAPVGIFGTKIPSSVCFIIGILLFFLPFAELKCSAGNGNEDSLFSSSQFGMSFTNSGFGLAIGSEWKFSMPLGDDKTNDLKKTMDSSKPNYYALVALILAVIGLALSFTTSRAWSAISAAAGLLSAAALIGLIIDLKKKSGDLTSQIPKTGNGFDVGEYTRLTLNFTPWFYVTIIILAVAGFFSYKRMQLIR